MQKSRFTFSNTKERHTKTWNDENCNYRILYKYFHARKYKYIHIYKILLFKNTKLGWTQLHFLSALIHQTCFRRTFQKKNVFFPGNLLLSNYSFYRYNYFYIYFYFYFHFYLHLLVASMLRLTELVTRLNAQFLILQTNSFSTLNRRCRKE